MELGTIIGTGIAILIMGSVLFVYLKTKDRKEPLVIVREENKIHLLLTDDEYYDFSIENIKNDEDKIYEMLKSVVASKAKELVGFVDRVQIDGSSETTKAKELLVIIQSARK